MLIPLGNVHSQQFMCTLFKIQCRLNNEINCSTKINQILLSEVVNMLLLLLLLHCLLLLQKLLLIVVNFFQVYDILLTEDL